MIPLIAGLNYGNLLNTLYRPNNNTSQSGGEYTPSSGDIYTAIAQDPMGNLMSAVNYLDSNTMNNAYGLDFKNTGTQYAAQPDMTQNNNMMAAMMNMMMSFIMNMFAMIMQSMMGNQNPALQNNNLFTGDNNTANPLTGNNYANPAGNYQTNPAAPAANNAPPLDLANTQGNALGQQIAQSAYQTASGMNSSGWCAKGVRKALEAIGINGIGAASAYMIADQLAGNPKFREVQCTREQLKSLPPGAIVVWGQTAEHPHGHISVALGDGREASDHVQGQITGMAGSTLRVFLPVG
jgi:hypothetical protein